MTNEEKAIDVSMKHYREYPYEGCDGLEHCIDSQIDCKEAALEMASWKDQKFEDYLKKKIANLEYFCSFAKTDTSIAKLKIEVYEDILNELFITPSYDYPDDDE